MRLFFFISFFMIVFIKVYGQTEVDSAKLYTLNPITITATKTEVPRNLVAPSVSVLTREILEQQPEKSVFSILSREVPGVFVTERGPIGFGVNSQAGQTFVRGIGGNPNTQVLTLIDGRPQFMGMMGHPVNDSYLSAHIDRVEVIRGPASLLYGTNAMGGVINIITKQNDRSGFSGSATASYGTYETRHTGITLGYQEGGWSTTVSYTNAYTKGHRPYSEYRGNSGYLKTSYTFDERYSLTLDGSITQFNTYDPGTITSPYINNWMHIRRGYVGISLDNNYEISKGGARILYNFGHHELSPYYGNKSWISDDFIVSTALFQSFSLFKNNLTTAGLTYDQFGGKGKNTSANYGYHSVYQYALYVHTQQTVLPTLLLNGGLRYDHNEMFGDALTPQFGASYQVLEGTTIRGFVGKGFRSPTVRELYLFPAPTPTLKPEILWNYEIGFSQILHTTLSAELTFFLQEGSNMIRTEGVYPNIRLSNSGAFVHRGVEASGTYYPLPHLNLRGSYSFLEVGNDTRSVPKHKMFASVSYSYDRAEMCISAQHIETIYGADNKQKKMPDYTIVTLDLSVQLLSYLSARITADNLLDETYYTIYGYPMPGRTVTIGIKTHF